MRLTLQRIQAKANAIGWQVTGDSKGGYYLQPQNQDWSCVPPQIKQRYEKVKITTLQDVDECLNWLHDVMQEWKLEQQAAFDIATFFYQKLQQLHPEQLELSSSQVESFLETVRNAVLQIQSQQEHTQREKQEAIKEANRQAWIAQQGLLTQQQIIQQWGLVHERQFFAAINLKWLTSIQTYQFPAGCYPSNMRRSSLASGYYRVNVATPLTPTDQEQLKRVTLLTRLQAAEFLEVTPQKFDKLKKQYSLTVAEERYTLSRNEPQRKYYLYSLADLIELQKHIGKLQN